MKALIDGDMVVYMACAANQIQGDFGDGMGSTPLYDEEEAYRATCMLIEKWTKASGASKPIVCFSQGDNFRKKIYPKYKSNRDGVERPKALQVVRDAIEMEYESWAIPGLEADDLMGIAGSRDPGNFVVVSRDKDMMTIPGTIFNPDHMKKPTKVRLSVADQIWMKQTMTGDTVDGYSGIPGVGEVSAQAILLNPRTIHKQDQGVFQKGKNKGKPKPPKWVDGAPCTLWQAMVSHAAKAGMSEPELITMARLARILRTGEFDTNTRTVKLWLPGGGYEELKLD